MNHPGEPVHPALYALAEDGTLDLLYLACGACGALTFPSSAYGCRCCGAAAEAGHTQRLAGLARVRQMVTVHQALTPALAAPYVVAELELAGGVVEEAILDVRHEGDLAPGMPVRAVPAIMPDGRFTCRFAPLEDAA